MGGIGFPVLKHKRIDPYDCTFYCIRNDAEIFFYLLFHDKFCSERNGLLVIKVKKMFHVSTD